MRRSGLVSVIASVATAGAVLAAPAFAAGSYVQVPLSSQFNAVTMLAQGSSSSQSASDSACHKTPGATFGPNHAVNATGLPTGKSFTTAAGVPYTLGTAGAKDAICVREPTGATASSQPSTITISVTPGKYSDAYFLASVANGPAIVAITPVYGSTKGSAIQAVFDDWCAPVLTGGALTPDAATAFSNTGDRVANNGGAPQANLPCTFYSTHVSGLSSSQTLTALDVTMEAAGTAIPTQTGVKSGTTQQKGAVLNIAALTLQGTASGGSSTATTSATTSTSTSTTSTTLPKTGGNPIVPLAGGLAALAGVALAIRPRRKGA